MVDSYIIVKEERRTIPKGACPVDLMGKIANEEKGPMAFVVYMIIFI